MGIQTRHRLLQQSYIDLMLVAIDLVTQLGGTATVPSILQMEKLYAESYLQDEVLPNGEHRLRIASAKIGGVPYS